MKNHLPPTPQGQLFSAPGRTRPAPLADRMRPQTLEEFLGQSQILSPQGFLRQAILADQVPSLILWGPPGSGKTSLAHVIAAHSQRPFVSFSAVLFGVKEFREVIQQARRTLANRGTPTLLFVDEIHHFNKSQQDAFLPHVEEGLVTLLGATTENPSFHLLAPLLSRLTLLVLEKLPAAEVEALLQRALDDPRRGLGELKLSLEAKARTAIARQADGDARQALNLLESLAQYAVANRETSIRLRHLREARFQTRLLYDRAGEEHYNLISAFIKSLRGSHPDAALYWLSRMLEGGENPLFIARRMVVFASEDIGNADPQALSLAIAVKEAVHFVGLPEAAINLAQAVTYLACAPKSNASYKGLLAAQAAVRAQGALPVPLHLRNAPTQMMEDLGYGEGYLYPHDLEEKIQPQEYLPTQLKERILYRPIDSGAEKALKVFLDRYRR